jgi:uncharacterized protein (DUF433 family)
MEKLTYITRNTDILGGKPIIKGSRISVEFILELVQSGASIKDICHNYPHLKEEAIREAINYSLKNQNNKIQIRYRTF